MRKKKYYSKQSKKNKYNECSDSFYFYQQTVAKMDEHRQMLNTELNQILKELVPRKRPSIKVEISDLPIYKKPLWSNEWPLKNDPKTP